MTDRDLTGVTIVFDLDGTLVDSAPDLMATLNRMLALHDLPQVPFSSARHLVGHGARALLEHGFAEAGATWDEARSPELFDAFIADYRNHIADQTRPFPGVVEALDRLAARGAVLCVATNKRTDLSRALIAALDLGRHFAAVVGPDAVSARKPDGAHLREAVLKAGGDPARAVMVGDSATDTGAARNVPMPCIVVSFGYTEIAPADLGGDLVIDAFSELEAALDRLIRRLRPSAGRAMSPPPRLMDA
ncbi:HAD hydrolase-like protein [uncultured Brevundimonas sp.]|uniref:HAD hydrolase-like protein n=1 Tax=uncultured Brevundimonas sp. TaxID=213418 RepID=UPI00262E7C08|nr:HAD hydrolase-like protein [uncultured Brevundimonas sp.]